MKRTITLCLLTLIGFFTASEASAQKDVHQDFETRKESFNDDRYFTVFDTKLTNEQRQCLEFLYAYMPISDLTDYNGDFWKMNVDESLQCRKEMSWGKTVPDREWYHFVLPVRINNENLDESRRVFFNEIKERVKGLPMKEAALEVNHWCHEKVSYQPSDSRTSAPLSAMRSAIGRCGEESTFCVAAMRSVGIPARQVYTPRWAHTDDNHAWVEVWVDGEWHFLGACEPEAVLDLGWFNAPASRGMLMHTKVFGKYDGPEEKMSQNNCFTEINVTKNYTPTAETKIKVVDTDGMSVQNATVEYKVYNYAEFFSVATKKTDFYGYSTISAGLGDFLVWVSKDDKFGLGKCTVGQDTLVTITLDKTNDFIGTFEIDLVPPVERNTIPEQTEKQIKDNKIRFAVEDSIRQAYINTMMTPETALAWVKKQNEQLKAEVGAEKFETMKLDEELLAKMLVASRGNHKTLCDFIEKNRSNDNVRLLATLSAKDLRDVHPAVLADFGNAFGCEDRMNYVNCPRISNELLTPWKSFLAGQKELKLMNSDPEKLAKWVSSNIMIDKNWNPQQLCMSPKSVYEHRVTDVHSRDIFYVAAARSQNIQARIDEVTGKVQYRMPCKNEGKEACDKAEKHDWVDVYFEGDAKSDATIGQGTLRASYNMGANIEDPKYYSHFSISKLVDCRPQLLNYPENGVTWSSLLKNGTTVDEGQYLLVSGTRMADGSVLCHMEFVPIFNSAITDSKIVMRESEEGVKVIGNFNSENIYCDDNEGKKSILSTTGRGYYIIGVIAPVEEPTNHALRDIALLKDELEQWGQKIVLLFKDDEEKARFTNKSEFQNLPNTIVWGTDVNNKIWNEMKEQMKLPHENRPVFLIADTFNRVVFMSQGYTIGLGEQLMGVIKKLK